MRIGIRSWVAVVGVSVAAGAWAKPKLEIAITAQKEVVETQKGVRVVKSVPAPAASPGEVIHYTLTYLNSGDEPATNAVVDDPIPKGSTYVANSATGEGAEITFSNDGGASYAPAVKLTYELKLPTGKVEKRVATPSGYTNIRWVLKRVPPGAKGVLEFQVKVN